MSAKPGPQVINFGNVFKFYVIEGCTFYLFVCLCINYEVHMCIYPFKLIYECVQ